MLIISRKPQESFQIGENIKVSIIEIKPNRVKISIEAPTNIRILRTELLNRDKK